MLEKLENNFIKIHIDDYIYFFDSDLNIFQACMEKNIFLPRFCYHNQLSISGNCRICSVEEIQSSKVILSCSTLIESGQVIYTETYLVFQARENVIEYLLINHPLDCPICDQGGECDLQDQTMLFGGNYGRFYENYKRAVENKNYNILIKFSLNRCIHCARCTRYCSEISSIFNLSLLGRGLKTEISFYTNFNELNSEISGNIIDLCPVGALTSKPYSFLGRLWEYLDIKYVDIFDDYLSNIRIDIRGTLIIRILPNYNYLINEEWISDKIRFNYDSYVKQRLIYPFFIIFNNFFFFSWLNCLFLLKNFIIKIINFFIINKKKNYNINLLSDKFTDFFSLFFIKKISFIFGWNNFSLDFSKKIIDFRKFYLSNFKFLNFIENLDFNIIFFNINLRFESPIFNLKLKKKLNSFNGFIFNLGVQNFNINTVSLGYNLKFLFKNFKLLNNYFLFYDFFFYFGHSFYFNNYFLIFLDYLKIFFKNFFNINFFFNYLTSISNKILNFEINSIINIKNFFNNNNKMLFLKPTILYNIDFDSFLFNFLKNKNHFFIYQGHHGDYFIKYSNLILPSKIFIEKSNLFINCEGFFNLFFYSYFTYYLSNIKNSLSILNILMNLLNSFNFYNNFNKIFFELNKISPIFLLNNLDYKTNIIEFYNNFNFNKFLNIEFNFNLFFFLINNFYVFDSISKFSIIMSLCSRKYSVRNDFKFNFLNYLYI